MVGDSGVRVVMEWSLPIAPLGIKMVF